MKKRIDLLLPLCILLLFFSCEKKEADMVVYQPPAPTISFSDVTDLIIDSTGKAVHLKAKVESKEGLKEIKVMYQPWNVDISLSSFTDPNLYALDVPVNIPANAALQIHSIVIKAIDKKGSSNFTEVKIGLQDLNYNKLYMADVTDGASLASDLFGVPLVMDKAGAHNYQLIYYARAAGVKVRFIPGKTSFTPVAIGADPANLQKLTTDGTKSLPIELGAKGYYKISVNTLLLTYKVEQFTSTGSAFNEIALVGRGFYDYPNMNWQNTLPDLILLDKDPVNPFLFTKEIKLGIPPGQAYNTAQFILTTNNGWTNFWRFDDGLAPELAVFNGGAGAEIPITTTPTSYLFIFDSYTGRIQAIKQQ
jgi:hypothetical protein